MGESYNINIGNINIDVELQIRFLYQDPRRVEPIASKYLDHPVVGSCDVFYKNSLGIKFGRRHNVYTDDGVNYYIDFFGNLVSLEPIDNYEIKYNWMSANIYTEFDMIKENRNFKTNKEN